jgi:hypothetical protein
VLSGIVLSRVITLIGAVLAMILTWILAGVLARLIIIAVIINRGNFCAILATVLAVILWRWGWRRRRGRSRTIRFASLALFGIDNHTGFTWLTINRRLYNNNVRLFFVLLLALAVELGIAAGTAQEHEGQQKALDQWLTHFITS